MRDSLENQLAGVMLTLLSYDVSPEELRQILADAEAEADHG
jgi:hypothetical protein